MNLQETLRQHGHINSPRGVTLSVSLMHLGRNEVSDESHGREVTIYSHRIHGTGRFRYI